MKNLILSLTLVCITFKVNAETSNIDTALRFDQFLTNCEKQWVVMKKPDSALYYTFGYVYIDGAKGFVFQKEGSFKIDKKSRYILNLAEVNKNFAGEVFRSNEGGMSGSWRIPPRVAILPSKHFKELKIKAEPDWIKPYYTYQDTLEHNYRWGCFYTEEFSVVATGISYLEKVYKVSPHYMGVILPRDKHTFIDHVGVELKLAAAYNFTHQYDKAIVLLNSAILNNSKNVSFYFELGSAYREKDDWKTAIDIYKSGLAQISVDKSNYKSWLAGFISLGYRELKNEQESKNWHEKAVAYNPHPGIVY
jgi:tetratricopeptide (TPR) repeat protein